MPEYFIIAVILSGLVMLAAALVIHTLNAVAAKITGSDIELAEKLDALSAKVAALEGSLSAYGRDLDAIHSEFALHITANDVAGADYQQAIKAASSGISSEEVMQTYGLRKAEAQLLVAVYAKR